MPPSPEAGGFLAHANAGLAGTGCTLRAAQGGDESFIAAVYATTRAEELGRVDWAQEQKDAFTSWQSGQQEKHYALHYPSAERLVVEQDGKPIGRIYVDTTRLEVRLMEVTLLPEWRNRGVGTRLTRLLVDYADALGRPASLHVEPFNPAKRMYDRFGFAVAETRGLYEFMVRPATAKAS